MTKLSQNTFVIGNVFVIIYDYLQHFDFLSMFIAVASLAGGIGGIAPQFLFLPLPPPPDLFLALPLYFFLKVSIAFTDKIVVILTVPSPILTIVFILVC